MEVEKTGKTDTDPNSMHCSAITVSVGTIVSTYFSKLEDHPCPTPKLSLMLTMLTLRKCKIFKDIHHIKEGNTI